MIELLKNEISILIPTFNDPCVGLVSELKAQADKLAELSGGEFRYEIIVADDASTDMDVVRKNSVISSMEHCRFLRRAVNEGRARIRNFLASQAQFNHVLFIDSDLFINSDSYIEKYATAQGPDIIYGGTCIGGKDPQSLTGNLRYIYEKDAEPAHKAPLRAMRPYSEFSAANFLSRREIVLSHPFDNRIKAYGYEDVLFGKGMKALGLCIEHIDNPMRIDTFETNAEFVGKSEEALRTLFAFREELEGYSNILNGISRLRRFVPLGLIRVWHRLAKGWERRNLESDRPNLTIFKLYKLGFYLSLS